MSLNVGNCPRCGRVFAKGLRDVCNECYKDIEKQYEICVQYLRENRGCHIDQLSNDTEVSVRQITKFIREGRISLIGAPNLAYPCDSCGTYIRESTMCESCRDRLKGDWKRVQQDSSRKQAEEPKKQAGFEIKDRK
jgi:flagellar operon protein (TIGR03826 family)